MAPETREDGFHEIQLSGKQLLFAVMAFMVGSAAVFLSGVLVGRNFERGRTPRLASLSASSESSGSQGSSDTKSDPASVEKPPTVVRPGYDPTKAQPPASSTDRADGKAASAAVAAATAAAQQKAAASAPGAPAPPTQVSSNRPPTLPAVPRGQLEAL